MSRPSSSARCFGRGPYGSEASMRLGCNMRRTMIQRGAARKNKRAGRWGLKRASDTAPTPYTAWQKLFLTTK
eukprot:6285827-Karenia_brevis.AAC.1